MVYAAGTIRVQENIKQTIYLPLRKQEIPLIKPSLVVYGILRPMDCVNLRKY